MISIFSETKVDRALKGRKLPGAQGLPTPSLIDQIKWIIIVLMGTDFILALVLAVGF